MTKDKALQSYFETFMRSHFPDLDTSEDDYYHTYTTQNIPTKTMLPYLAYELIDNDFGDGEVAIVVYLWMHTDSEAKLNEASRALKNYIEDNDMIVCDDGAIWVKPGSPWSSSVQDETYKSIRGRYINVTLEYLT